MQHWHSGEWLHMGIAGRRPLPNGALMPKPFLPYVECLHHWQRRFNRVTELDEDPYDSSVNLRMSYAQRKSSTRLRMPIGAEPQAHGFAVKLSQSRNRPDTADSYTRAIGRRWRVRVQEDCAWAAR